MISCCEMCEGGERHAAEVLRDFCLNTVDMLHSYTGPAGIEILNNSWAFFFWRDVKRMFLITLLILCHCPWLVILLLPLPGLPTGAVGSSGFLDRTLPLVIAY